MITWCVQCSMSKRCKNLNSECRRLDWNCETSLWFGWTKIGGNGNEILHCTWILVQGSSYVQARGKGGETEMRWKRKGEMMDDGMKSKGGMRERNGKGEERGWEGIFLLPPRSTGLDCSPEMGVQSLAGNSSVIVAELRQKCILCSGLFRAPQWHQLRPSLLKKSADRGSAPAYSFGHLGGDISRQDKQKTFYVRYGVS